MRKYVGKGHNITLMMAFYMLRYDYVVILVKKWSTR